MVWAAAPLGVNADDFEFIYPLLTRNLVSPADEPIDPLAVAMVARANAYLQMLHSKTSSLIVEMEAVYRPRQVTRNDLVDLGNPQSRMVRQLVMFLLRAEKGFQQFCRLGVLRSWPQEQDWKVIQSDVANKRPKEVNHLPGFRKLLAVLKPWTYKMVLTHFHRQQRDGRIEGHQTSVNAPWVYTVPETLAPGRSAFHNLPAPAAIVAALAAGATLDDTTVVCPDCPPLAQPAGQTEV